MTKAIICYSDEFGPVYEVAIHEGNFLYYRELFWDSDGAYPSCYEDEVLCIPTKDVALNDFSSLKWWFDNGEFDALHLTEEELSQYEVFDACSFRHNKKLPIAETGEIGRILLNTPSLNNG